LPAHLLFPSRLPAPSALSSLSRDKRIFESNYRMATNFLHPFSPVHVFSLCPDPH
jgi:hypothetical protein